MGNPKAKSVKLLLVAAAAVWWLALLQPKPAGASKVRHFKWAVEYTIWAPDCVETAVMGINGQYPGPTIRARAGDTIHVELTNGLSTEGVVIHWHGIRQLGTPWADGTASISQCPIRPGESFTYRFQVDKAGTYFYHGHYGMQRSAGLYGSLIVHVAEGEEEPFHYDGEFNLLLSDWWQRNSLELELDLSSKPFRWIGEPQSLLINGRGQYNCSLAPGIGNSSTTLCELRGTEQCTPQILRVLPNKVYRLRLASVTSLASLNLAIQGHKMVVVEADGNYVQPFTVEDLDIYSGESYSILLTTDQPPTTNYWLSLGVRGRQPTAPPPPPNSPPPRPRRPLSGTTSPTARPSLAECSPGPARRNPLRPPPGASSSSTPRTRSTASSNGPSTTLPSRSLPPRTSAPSGSGSRERLTPRPRRPTSRHRTTSGIVRQVQLSAKPSNSMPTFIIVG